MRRNYQVMMDKETGIPYAQIDNPEMWDLVEYLSNRRTAVTYTYCNDFFVVRFPHLDSAAAQTLLDEWANAEEDDQYVPSRAPAPEHQLMCQ